MNKEKTDKIYNAITSNGCREMDEERFHQAVNEALNLNKMIVFKDAEKHEPKRDDEYLCIVKCDGELYYENIFWRNSRWVVRKDFNIKVIAFSETPPETALKGISEDLICPICSRKDCKKVEVIHCNDCQCLTSSP